MGNKFEILNQDKEKRIEYPKERKTNNKPSLNGN